MSFEEEILSMVEKHDRKCMAEAKARGEFESSWKNIRKDAVSAVFGEAKQALGAKVSCSVVHENGWTELQLAGNSYRLRFHGDPTRQRVVCATTAGSPPEEIFEASAVNRSVVEGKVRELVSAYLGSVLTALYDWPDDGD